MNEETETEILETDEIESEELEEVVSEEEVTEIANEESDEKPSRTKNAKARLKRKLQEEREARERLEIENRKQQERLDALEQKVDGVVNPPAQRPVRIDFDTEEDYEDALYDFRMSKSEKSTISQTPPDVASQVQPIVSKEMRENWDTQLDNGFDKYDDFQEVVFNKSLVMTDPMTFTVMESDVGSDIAYFLGKNPREADRISRLSVAAQVREIDKIGSKFTKNTTKAPAPIKPIGGKGDVSGKIIDPLLEGATFT